MPRMLCPRGFAAELTRRRKAPRSRPWTRAARKLRKPRRRPRDPRRSAQARLAAASSLRRSIETPGAPSEIDLAPPARRFYSPDQGGPMAQRATALGPAAARRPRESHPPARPRVLGTLQPALFPQMPLQTCEDVSTHLKRCHGHTCGTSSTRSAGPRARRRARSSLLS